jgi:hypothetical protein
MSYDVLAGKLTVSASAALSRSDEPKPRKRNSKVGNISRHQRADTLRMRPDEKVSEDPTRM